jgi:hypothetical protein
MNLGQILPRPYRARPKSNVSIDSKPFDMLSRIKIKKSAFLISLA